MKKRLLHSLLAGIMLFSLFTANPVAASAVSPSGDPEIQPRYTGIHRLVADLDINPKTGYASCYGQVGIVSGYTVTLTVSLFQDGTSIKSWSDTGTTTFSIEKGYYVAEGHDYEVVVTASVKNSNGVVVNTPSLTSNTVTY